MRRVLLALVIAAGIARADRIPAPEAKPDTRDTIVLTNGNRAIEVPLDESASLLANGWHIETRQELDAREAAERARDRGEPTPWWQWPLLTIGAGAVLAIGYTFVQKRR